MGVVARRYTFIDLFSGAGGLTLGFRMAGFEPLLAIDSNHEAMLTYKRNNLKVIAIEEDIHKVDAEKALDMVAGKFGDAIVDVVVGGPPCEGFSIAGDRDPNDPRNRLFEELIRFVAAVKPKIVVVENVKGLLSMKDPDGSLTVHRVIKSFSDIGYRVGYKVLNAIDYGVPQVRERVFFIATRLGIPIVPPRPTNAPANTRALDTFLGNGGPGALKPYVTVWEAIGDLPPLAPGEEKTAYEVEPFTDYQKQAREDVPRDGLRNHKVVKHRKYMVERFKRIPPGEGLKDVWDSIPSHLKPRKLYSARCRRLDPDKPAFTVTSHCLDEMIHPYQHRAITPREAARLQSFPDWYVFEGPLAKFHSDPKQDQYEQVGDAVPPLLAKAVAEAVKKMLDEGLRHGGG